MNRREYRQGARAVTARVTGERIIDALVSLFLEQPLSEIRLADVAQRAGVTVQTVIRRFESKNGLVAAAVERVSAEIAATRATVVPGDVGAAVANLVEHYEQAGDLSLKLLAEEPLDPSGRSIADLGRDVHRRWCEAAFAPALDRLTGATRQRRLAQLVAICDVATWKLLRRDAGLSRAQTELALTEMLTPLTEET
ncbi:TetR/AcrR family transcriptional regulator [Micromonospora sp. PLK6-60]|uniref:TetR/AcrR family transcriptional regulator n=1 Tax=Micromonospora sp. PLK6-60 TaxID=2873383 RepID=UPI001CA79E84|nr:TetR/AcrR family transcriptional regulator [Micromonospora sp. PLK6-60]MBY8872491.1 TetR/AcrR family transcriptional regulator [Micromonospora sp. PLK6-60]